MQWKSLFQENVIKGSELYLKKGAVQNYIHDGNIISADVKGMEDFHVDVETDNQEAVSMKCSCPLSKSGQRCKHMAAVLLYAEQNDVLDNLETMSEEDIAVETPVKETKMVEAPVTETIEDKKPVTYMVNWPFINKHDENLTITAEVNPVFAFSVYQNGNALIENIKVVNNSEKEYKNLVIRAYCDYYFFDMDANNCGNIGPNDTYQHKAPVLLIHGNALRQLTEKITCNLHVCLTYGNEEVARYSKEISVLAMNQWPGVDYDEVLLASYITPNHPIITNLLYFASNYLEKQTGSPSLDAYQSGKPQRVLEMANAVYAAIQAKNIRYATSPAGFIHDGQKIRFADEIMAVHMGNCMDMTLLYAACIEQMGLHPVLVLVEGHIFSGVWLKKKNFSSSFTTDPSQIEKEIEMGNLIVVESTNMCAGDTISFDEAMANAKFELKDYSSFDGVLDIRRARMGNVKPMPLEKRDTGFFEVEHRELNEDEITGLTKDTVEEISLGDLKAEKVTKLDQWERKLLDLSTRNPLISISKKAIPLLVTGINEIEDAFAENVEYKLCPLPEEWKIRGADAILAPEGRSILGEYEDMIRQDVKKRRLHTIISNEKALEKEMTRMYRATKDSMAENGANTLYLVLGELRWTEAKSEKSRMYYAPIVLLPVEMIRKSANEGYVLRGLDDETLINITLLEFMKQKFNIEIPELNRSLTEDSGLTDEHGYQ